MKKLFPFACGLLVLCVLFIYMFSFKVAFNQTAVRSTFGKADAADVVNAGDKDESGLHFKWPWPIQQVSVFDKRLRVMEDLLEQQETKDKQVIILKTYLVWRVSEPLQFQRSLRDEANAERFLRDRLRSARAVVGGYSFDELSNLDPAKLRLAEVESGILGRMRQELEGKACGVELDSVGVKRILLPEQITASVFEHMRQTRRRLAQNARSEGEAIARSIKAKASSDAQRIASFADRKAQNIRAEGDAAAASYYRVFAQNEEFAIFIRKLEVMESVLSKNSSFLIDAKTEPFDLLLKGLAPLTANTGSDSHGK